MSLENFIKPKITKKEVKPKKKLEESLPIDARFEELAKRFNEYEETGVKITGEIARNTIKEVLGVSISEFFDQKIGDPSVRIIHKNVAEKIKGIMSENTNNKETVLSYLREKMFKSNFNKAIAFSIILFFKFNPSFGAQKVEKDTLPKKQTEASVVKVGEDIEGGDGDGGDGMYKATKGNLRIVDNANSDKVKEVFSINMTNSFEVDKADISSEDLAKIQEDLRSFLGNINHNNFKDFNTSKITLMASSSEEPTRYGAEDKNDGPILENNIKLSEDRAQEVKTVLEKTINDYDFSKSGFTPSEVQELKNIQFEKSIPEKGYTKISELNLINPLTGEKYTDKDVEEMKKNDRKLYDKLSQECRYVKVSITVESNIEPKIINLDGYDEWSIYFDDSPSMESVKKEIQKEFLNISKSKIDSKKPGKIFFFSKNIDLSKDVPNSAAAANEIMSMEANGSDTEKAFTSLVTGLSKLIESDKLNNISGKEIPKRLAVVYTNEGFQDGQEEAKAKELAKKTNTDVKINFRTTVVKENGKRVVVEKTVGLDEFDDRLNNAVKIIVEKKINQLDQQGKLLDQQGKQLAEKLIDAQLKLSSLTEEMKDIGIKDLKKVLPNSNFETFEEVKVVLEASNYNYDIIQPQKLDGPLEGKKTAENKKLLFDIRHAMQDLGKIKGDIASNDNKKAAVELSYSSSPKNVEEFMKLNPKIHINSINVDDGKVIELPIWETQEDVLAKNTNTFVSPVFINL